MLLHELHHAQSPGCQVVPLEKPASPEQLSQAETAVFLVRGMGCPTCALRVRNGLLRMDGVVAADVVLSHGLAKIWYDPKLLQPEAVATRLPAVADEAGHHYTARLLAFSDEP